MLSVIPQYRKRGRDFWYATGHDCWHPRRMVSVWAEPRSFFKRIHRVSVFWKTLRMVRFLLTCGIAELLDGCNRGCVRYSVSPDATMILINPSPWSAPNWVHFELQRRLGWHDKESGMRFQWDEEYKKWLLGEYTRRVVLPWQYRLLDWRYVFIMS